LPALCNPGRTAKDSTVTNRWLRFSAAQITVIWASGRTVGTVTILARFSDAVAAFCLTIVVRICVCISWTTAVVVTCHSDRNGDAFQVACLTAPFHACIGTFVGFVAGCSTARAARIVTGFVCLSCRCRRDIELLPHSAPCVLALCASLDAAPCPAVATAAPAPAFAFVVIAQGPLAASAPAETVTVDIIAPLACVDFATARSRAPASTPSGTCGADCSPFAGLAPSGVRHRPPSRTVPVRHLRVQPPDMLTQTRPSASRHVVSE
jgi:hypothetical protein